MKLTLINIFSSSRYTKMINFIVNHLTQNAIEAIQAITFLVQTYIHVILSAKTAQEVVVIAQNVTPIITNWPQIHFLHIVIVVALRDTSS